jgi:glycosyltransferase, group 2 family
MSDLINNPLPRCATILALDVSGSMDGDPIKQLKAGALKFIRTVKEDDIASASLELAIVLFGGDNAKLLVPFTNLSDDNVNWHEIISNIDADGSTPMGEAVELSLNLLEKRKEEYKNNGVSYYQPWFVMITDGEPTDSEWEKAARRLYNAEQNKRVFPMVVGTKDADFYNLEKFVSEPIQLEGLKFQEFFSWLSASMSRVSTSVVGEEVTLPPKTGWQAL